MQNSKVQNMAAELPGLELSALAASLVPKLKEFYADEGNRKAFEQWYYNKYGEEYQWKSSNH